MPIDIETLRSLLETEFPDAEIRIEDLRGDGDHYSAHITSPVFQGKTRVRQHKMVHNAVRTQIESGTLHALAIQTAVPDDES